MLNELIKKGRCTFEEGFCNWEDAVHAACKPLLDQKAIDDEYILEIISSIKKHGPYIVIAPNICIPHAQEGNGVNETAICFMKTEKPVHFNDDPQYDARLFFVLASINNDHHMENLVKLVSLIENEETVDKLLNAKTIEDLQNIK